MRQLRRAVLVLALGAFAPALGQPSPEGRARLARVEEALEAWDVEEAKRQLEALAPASGTAPEPEPVAYFRGRIAFEEGRYEEAIDLLGRAGIADEPGSYLRLAKETQAIVGGHQRAESEHFILLFPEGKDAVLTPYALESLEAIRRALIEDLGHAPPGKIRVEVLNDGRELSRMSTLSYEQISKTGTIAICKFNKLMITSPKAVLRGYDWLDTLAHEYIHLVVSQRSGNTVPIWLHEGLAKYLESRWRGGPGDGMPPSTLALLGRRVRQDKLIPFEKMHPSIALLPTAEDAATAFAEVFFAVDLIHRDHGTAGLRKVLDGLQGGKTDKAAVAEATGKGFAQFERAWLLHIKRQKFPDELLPLTTDKKVLKEEAPGQARKEEERDAREISFGGFAEVTDVQARKLAHLGELMRERDRGGAAAELYGKAHARVGDRYQSVSNKYALALLERGRTGEARTVLEGSLRLHPGVASTHVHLGRIHLHRQELEAARGSFLQALAIDPFNPEIHLALLHIHRGLGDAELMERARGAAVLLTGLSEQEVDRISHTLVRVPAAPEASGEKPDAKAPSPEADP